MNYLPIYLLESSICLAAFHLFYLIVLRQQPSHQYNRFYLLSTLLLSFVLPLLEIPIVVDGSVASVAGGYQNYILLDPALLSTDEGNTGTQSWLTWPRVLVGLYFMGVLVSLGAVLRQAYQLLSVVRQGKIEQHPGYKMVYTHGLLPSSSFFKYLFWDDTQALSPKEAGQIIAHERAHIAEGHSYDVVCINLLKIIFWFQPLVYLYERTLTDVHEFTADAQAIQNHNPGSYARLLTRSLFAGIQPSLVNHFYKSRTLKRIKMMHTKNEKLSIYRYLLALPLLATAFFTFSCQTEEELEKEAIVATYDDVQAQMKDVGGQIQALTNKYFETPMNLREMVNKESEKYVAGSAPPPSFEALQLAVFEDVATRSDYEKFKKLLDKANDLQAKLRDLPDAEGVFMIVDNQPKPEGGMTSFYQYIMENLKYPLQARQQGIEGKVFTQFVVNEYGELTEFKTLKGIGHGCDQEAIRVLKEAEAWAPGSTNGKPVKVRMVMPINFALDDSDAKEKPTGDSVSQANQPSSNMEEVVAVGYRK